MHRLEPIARIGQRPRHDHTHGIVQVGHLHLALDIDLLDRTNFHGHLPLVGFSTEPTVKYKPKPHASTERKNAALSSGNAVLIYMPLPSSNPAVCVTRGIKVTYQCR